MFLPLSVLDPRNPLWGIMPTPGVETKIPKGVPPAATESEYKKQKASKKRPSKPVWLLGDYLKRDM